MRSLIYEGPNALAWRSVPEPAIGSPGDALVAPVAVAVCDLDVRIVRGRTPFPPPFALGHECVARVVGVGAAVRGFAPGDLVVVPFRISCGICAPCVAGFTAHCATVPERTAGYGFGAAGGPYGGVLSDLVRVPYADAMLVSVPDAVDPVSLASCCDNVADGWRTVAPALLRRPGATVLVVGGIAASVGLYAVASAIACGAAHVAYADPDPDRLSIARMLGARPLEGYAARPKPAYDVTVDASGTAPGLEHALRATAPEGELFVASMYFGDATPMPMYAAYMRGIAIRTGRVHSRAVIPHVLDAVARGVLRPEVVTTKVADWDDAAEAILEGSPGKLVIRR